MFVLVIVGILIAITALSVFGLFFCDSRFTLYVFHVLAIIVFISFSSCSFVYSASAGFFGIA